MFTNVVIRKWISVLCRDNIEANVYWQVRGLADQLEYDVIVCISPDNVSVCTIEVHIVAEMIKGAARNEQSVFILNGKFLAARIQSNRKSL